MTAAAPLSGQLPRPGDTIAGKYVLDRLLGQGGMGAVFAARHIKLSKAVAIKIMLADTSNPEALQRFINEGRAAANIQNEHVVRVDDVDEEMGYAYMVLELLDGEDLAQILEREAAKRIAPHLAVDYVLQALKGVMQAHAIGIVHRDLKPSNLFLARRKDGSVVVKVLDFGISKAQGSSALAASPSALTSTKAMLGSPLYMSPEQLRSSKSVDHRADIWAIGVILYELITGTLPFMGDNLGELFAAILETDPTPLRQRANGVHPGLEDIVTRCLARKPESRFQTALELAQALGPYAHATGQVADPVPKGTAMLGPGAAFPGGTGPHPGMSTPSGGGPRPMSSSSSITGSGPRPVGGTVALGAATPSGAMYQSGSGWQSTGSARSAGVPKSNTPLVAALIGGAVFVVGAVVLFFALKAKSNKPIDPTVASSGVAPSISVSVLATTPPAPSSAPTPTASVAASVPPAVTPPTTPVAITPPVKPTPTGHTVPSKPADPKPPEPKTPDPVPSKKPPPPVTPPNPNGGLQNNR